MDGLTGGTLNAGGGVNPPRFGFWERPGAQGTSGGTSGVPVARGVGAQPNMALPLSRCAAGRLPVVRHTNPEQLMFGLREKCDFLSPAPDMHEFDRSILESRDVVPANASAYERFKVLVMELIDHGLGALVVQDSGVARQSVAHTPHDLHRIRAQGNWGVRFDPTQGGYSVWALDCLPAFPGADYTADQWNSLRWPDVQDMVRVQVADVCAVIQAKRERIGHASTVAAATAIAEAAVQAAMVAAGRVAVGPPPLPALPPLVVAPQVAQAVPMDAESARVERPASLGEYATDAEYALFGRRTAAYQAQCAAGAAAKTVARVAREAAERVLREAAATERAEAERHVPDEVRPSGTSTAVPESGQRGDVRHYESAYAKELFKPAPPSKYSGDEGKIRVAQWLRSMLTYLQLTNTPPASGHW